MSFRYPGARLLIFAKAPQPGLAKTRLIPALGADGAARLHEELVWATVRRMADAALCRIELWVTPEPRHPLFLELARLYDVSLHTQHGGDLGERMYLAARDALIRCDAAVLIGTDCPPLGAAAVEEALTHLRRCDAVIAPAEDGGYGLLALKKIKQALFVRVPWGSAEVAAVTRDRMSDLGWCWRELDTVWDVDRPEDLERYGNYAGDR